MRITLKPIDHQVIVITGASSGIGLATAELAAARGARLVLAARSEDTLRRLTERLARQGAEAIYCVCDVGNREQVEALARAALSRFGRIDTWINDAGVSIYGRLDEVREEDNRRLFDTNFWGVCNGSLAALPHLRISGGALINIGSEVSEDVIPLQGMYCASKHAVKGFTDALRIEVQEVDQSPVSITLVEPTAVDTPYPQHARNYMQQEPKLPAPMVTPERVADAILKACVTPTRVVRVGSMATINTAMARLTPMLADKIAAKYVDRQHYDEAPRNPDGTLFQAIERTQLAGQTHGAGGRMSN